MHKRREVLAEPDRIEDCESHLARRHRGQHPQHQKLQHLNGSAPTLFIGRDEQHRMLVERHQCRQLHGGCRWPQPFVLRNAVLHPGKVERQLAELNCGRGLIRHGPVGVVGRVPIGEQPLALSGHALPGFA
jgi:hypothetical protein